MENLVLEMKVANAFICYAARKLDGHAYSWVIRERDNEPCSEEFPQRNFSVL